MQMVPYCTEFVRFRHEFNQNFIEILFSNTTQEIHSGNYLGELEINPSWLGRTHCYMAHCPFWCALVEAKGPIISMELFLYPTINYCDDDI